QIVPTDAFGPYETSFEIGVNPACGLRGPRTGPEGPGPGLLLAHGEERPQAHQLISALDEAFEAALAEAERLEHLLPLGPAELGGFGFELNAHADDLGAAPELGFDRGGDLVDAVDVGLTDVDQGHHRFVGEKEL